MKSRALIVSFLLSIIFSCAQESNIPINLIPSKYQSEKINSDYKTYKSKAVDLTKYLPKNYSKKGDIDYTKYLQKGLDENRTVLFPNFPILVDDTGLTISSNSILLFNDDSQLLLQASSKDTYEILRVHQVDNVRIFNANITGDSKKHLGKTGEWGMGIAIRSSTNIELYNPKIQNCWGDGIYVGQIWNKAKNVKRKLEPVSKNITIYNAFINANGRNGLSLVAIDGIKVYNSFFANSKRTFPKSGIDIEPGPGITTNIEIVNCVTYNNGARGIDFMLRKLPSMKNNDLNVTIKNHTDDSSPIGLRIAGYKKAEPSTKNKIISGSINIDAPKLSNNRINAIDIESNQSLAPKIIIKNYKGAQKLQKSLEKVNNAKAFQIVN